MSFYAKYLTERTNDKILETNHGFATYRYLPEEGAVYIVDIFVDTDFRNTGAASQMADKIAEMASKEGYGKMYGSVIPSLKNSTASIKVLLAYGMRVKSAFNDFIFFEKEI